jgi:hypothetical protein
MRQIVGPVWTALYISMAVAAWLVWRQGELWQWPLALFAVQLALNAAWSWLFFGFHMPGAHYSGKIAVVGHTPQKEDKILDAGYLKCIDTGCGFGGRLTALDVNSGTVWRVDEYGERATT